MTVLDRHAGASNCSQIDCPALSDRGAGRMFRQIHEIALTIFLLQGLLITVLLLVSGIVWARQIARLTVMEKAIVRDRKQRGTDMDSLLDALPKLQPLHCAGCGSPVALEARSGRCIACASLSELPPDYRATRILRRALARVSAAAIRDWRIARVLASRPVLWLLRLMVVAEPLLFVLVMIGAVTFGDTNIDRALDALPNEVENGLMTLAVCGFIIWTIVLVMLAALARDVKDKVPAFPDVRPGELGAAEYAACHACGGGIAFRPGAFAALCPYCAVATFRPAFARRERERSEEQQVLTRASMFGALEIIEGFTGFFFITMAIMSVALAVLIGVAAFAANR
jgi:hypothetical protein